MSTEPDPKPESEPEHAEWAFFHSYWGWICRECEAAEGWAKLDGRDHGHGCLKQPLGGIFQKAKK